MCYISCFGGIMEDNEIKANKHNNIFSIIAWIITGILFVLTLILMIIGIHTIRQGKMVKIFGYSYSVIVSNSMEPTINVNDIIIINTMYDFDDIKEDDIIVFYNPKEDKNIAHRVVNRIEEDNTLETLGDNNNGLVDSFHVSKDEYIGKVVKYGSFLGIGSLITNGRVVFFIALAAIFLYIIVSELITIYNALMLKKHENRLEEIKKQKEEEKIALRAKMKEELRKELEKEKQ